MLILGLLLTGCASGTRMVQFGPLANGERLVTLMVSEDRGVVSRECGAEAAGVPSVLGCQKSWPVRLGDGRAVRAVTIVRYTDALPSALAFEIDAHELCHAVATIQTIADPCHDGNGGVIQASVPAVPRSLARGR